uniref:NADH dehydrogenase subunit 5 n=1 Tax=Cobbenicoris guangxiensis TaxID=3020184 RepID=UPI002410BB00|nr:NADH dehydrogenase subunit 5 [Cobbenicoris guangxiensis]WEM32396.1 NADH dehydrogenase subunit 5 [Cobbenicoris guangxiensis]
MNLYYFWCLFLFILSLSFFLVFMLLIKFDFSLFMDWDITFINSSCISMTLLLDWKSLLFMSCVSMISSMVVLYSKDYMFEDKFNYRFLILVLLFVVSMFFLIISPNMISILLGWDGLGLISYCLVIYFGNLKSYNAGMLTILINRLGDVLILMSLCFIMNFGGWNFIFYFFYWEDWMIDLSLMIIFASFTKSAQIPFSSWLPAAMAAPTPVSSLVHSSTLVTAGVYVLIRFDYLLSNLDLSLYMYLSLLTMFMSGLGANFEFDLKKIIALSTLSQLGMMMLVLFVGNSSLSFFHLLSHAFFKALLFLCSGLIIHCMSDSQDIRHMGNLINQLPYTCACFCISSMSLCGLPFLSGFYSKDYILEYSSLNYNNYFVYLILFISVGLTVTYSVRLVYYCLGGFNGLFVYQSCIESNNMLMSMMFLVILSVMSGSLFSWLIYPFSLNMNLPVFNKFIPILCIMIGLYLGYEMTFFYWFLSVGKSLYLFTRYFLGSMWFMSFFYTSVGPLNFLYVSKLCWNFNDSMWGEYYMSRFIPQLNYLLSSNMLIVESYNLKNYIKLFMIIMFLIYFLF